MIVLPDTVFEAPNHQPYPPGHPVVLLVAGLIVAALCLLLLDRYTRKGD